MHNEVQPPTLSFAKSVAGSYCHSDWKFGRIKTKSFAHEDEDEDEADLVELKEEKSDLELE